MTKTAKENIVLRNIDMFHSLLDEIGIPLTNPEYQLQAIQQAKEILTIDKHLKKVGQLGYNAWYFLNEIDKEIKQFETEIPNPQPVIHGKQINKLFTTISEYAEMGYSYLDLIHL